jgi:hypothetical protein
MDLETIYAFAIAGIAGLAVIGLYYLIKFISTL